MRICRLQPAAGAKVRIRTLAPADIRTSRKRFYLFIDFGVERRNKNQDFNILILCFASITKRKNNKKKVASLSWLLCYPGFYVAMILTTSGKKKKIYPRLILASFCVIHSFLFRARCELIT